MDNLESKQLRLRILTPTRGVLIRTLILLVLVLIILPFWTSFQDALTQFVMQVSWYRGLQDWIVPYELRVVGLFYPLLGFPFGLGEPTSSGLKLKEEMK